MKVGKIIMEQKLKPSLFSYNILRGGAALCVLAYHLNGNKGWSFGIFEPLIYAATLYMTLFFVLSGFILSYNYSSSNFFTNNSIFTFYKKRIVSIFPIYYCVYFFFLFLNQDPIKDIFITFPIQFLLLQEFQHYSFLQNDGMWFLSDIMFCYFLFPLLCYIIREKNNSAFFLIIFIISSVMPFVASRYGLNLYTNILSRVLEFSMGIFLYYNIQLFKQIRIKHIYIYA